MTDPIERIDRKRMNLLRLYLTGAVLFFTAWLARFILHETGVLPNWLDYAIAVPFAAGALIVVLSVIGLFRIRGKIVADPVLKEALNDELAQLNNLRATRYGFFAMMGGLAFFSLFNFLSPVKDFFGVMLTIFWAGAWGYLLAFYRLEKD